MTQPLPPAVSTVLRRVPSGAISFGGRSATPCDSRVRARSTGSPPAPTSWIAVDHLAIAAAYARRSLQESHPGLRAAAIALNGDITLKVAGIVREHRLVCLRATQKPAYRPVLAAESTIRQQIAGDQFGGFVERHPHN